MKIPGSMQQLMKQAQKMQKEAQKAQQDLEQTCFKGSASGDMVSISLSGDYEVQRVSVHSDVLKDSSSEMIEGLVQCALEDVLKQIAKRKEESFKGMPKGLV